MKRRGVFLRLAALALSVLFVPAAFADAPDPAVVQVQGFYDVLLATMKHAKDLGVKGRFDKLKPAIEKSFALSDMLRAAVGPKWTTLAPADQALLLAAFERKTVAEYASNFDGFSGEKFAVDPRVAARGADKIVQSKLFPVGQAAVPFGYRMRQVDGVWKVLDIYLDGVISQLATQRSEFATTLSASGAAGLAKQLNAKADKLLGGG
jgi:phospholipid transport system substrate-binding protein